MHTKSWIREVSPPVPCDNCGALHFVGDLHPVARGQRLVSTPLGLAVKQPRLCVACLTPAELADVVEWRARIAEHDAHYAAENDDTGDFCRCDCCGEPVDDLETLARREELVADATEDADEEIETSWVCRTCATPAEIERADAWKREHAALERADRDGDDDSAFDRAREDDGLPF